MKMEVKDLEIIGIIGFDGATKKGLQIHPDHKHLIYPMGNKITIKNIDSGKQIFLSGHTNVISALCVSPCGKFIASGQLTHLGFKATVIIWDYEEKTMKGSYEIHKVRIDDLSFSCESNYLISLGGSDDGNIVIWDVHKNEAICGSFASSDTAGNALTITRTNIRDECFVTGGDRTLKVWRINPETRKVYGVNVKVGKVRRTINCIVIDARDEEAYCGTSSGDIIKARLNYYHNTEEMEPVQPPIMVGCYSKISKEPKKRKEGEGDLYSGGVTSLVLFDNGKMCVGTGDGTVELIEFLINPPHHTSGKLVKLPTTPQIRTFMTENVRSAVTSMLSFKNDSILVGTVACEIYQISLSDFDTRLVITCHTNTIYAIAFPHNYAEIFATGSKNDIRLWHLESQRELLRITVPNFVCTNLCFSHDGNMLLSAWNDGIVRSFLPRSGQLKFAIHNAHIKAVSAICITSDSKKLVTGGCDGQIRIWGLLPDVQKLMCVMKEHRGPISSLHMAWNDVEAISSSTDGTCIIWDIERCIRKQVLMGNTMYMAAQFSPNGIQILTCGTDRKIAYWETLDGSLVRELEGSTAGALNCLDISPDGRYFVTGSHDCIVKIWEYHNADTTHIGVGHAATITACKFSPDSKYLVTLSADGAILVWKYPFDPVFESPPESAKSRSTCSIREEEWRKLRLRDRNNDKENVQKLSARSGLTESVRTVHENNSKIDVCNYDPVKPSPDACQCRDGEEKEPISEKGSGKMSTSSKNSVRSSGSTTTTRSSGSKLRHQSLPQCVIPRADSGKQCDGALAKLYKSAVTTGDCIDGRTSIKTGSSIRGNEISLPKTCKPKIELSTCRGKLN